MSPWIHEDIQPGDTMFLRGPYGECFYVPGQPERPLLLIGTGTGAAPLWGIVRHALNSGHSAPIVFMHKGHDEDALYLHEHLLGLEEEHENISYHPCVTIDGGAAGVANGVHYAFFATNREEVQDFYDTALAHGARGDGAPGPRPEYGAPYFGCFVRDLDGHKMEATFWDVSAA